VGLKLGGMTQYEYVSLTIQSFAKIKDNLEELNRRLRENDKPNEFLQEISGLTLHASKNAPAVLIESLEEILNIFEEQYNFHASNETLADFFQNAFNDGNICFEARARHLEEYASSHPTRENGPVVDVKMVVDYTKESSFEKIFEEEIRVFREKQIREGTLGISDMADSQKFKDYLINEKKICEIEGKDEGGKIRQFSEEDVNRLIDYYKDIVMILI
jgi:hypothetical protein